MGGKSGTGQVTPYEAPNTLSGAQSLRIIDAIAEGVVAGFANGDDAPFKSVYFDDTPVQNPDGSFNFNGVTGYFQRGEQDQSYVPGFAASERTVPVSAAVKQGTPVVGLGNDIAVQAEGVRFVRGQPVAYPAEINDVFRIVVKVALIVVKTLFADGYPHAVFQRFLMPDNRNKQHRADKTVGLVGIADDTEIRITFRLISNAFFFTELIIGIGSGKAERRHVFMFFAAGSASVHDGFLLSFRWGWFSDDLL